MVCSVWHTQTHFACIRDRHPRRHARSHKQTLAKFSTRPLSNCSKALPHCYSSPAYLFSLAACFHFLNEHLSFLSILSLFCFTENQSVYVRAYFCLCCVSAFWQPERGPPENRSLDTEKQQVKAIFWHLLVAAGLFVRPAQSQGYCVCVDLCVCSFQTGRGNQSGLVWSFVFIDKCTRQNRRTIEKFVLLWSPVGGCVCARKIGQILVMLNWSHESLKCFKVGWVLHTTACA